MATKTWKEDEKTFKSNRLNEGLGLTTSILSNIKDKFIINKINKFISSDIMKNIKNAKIYKEYEFIYNIDNIKYHGIIDLMNVYDDHIDIIDYKLKNISDIEYKKQLNIYKEYISSITNKKVHTYLYSIIDNILTEV